MLTKFRKHRFHDGRSGAALTIRVIPRASRTEIANIMEDGTVRIRVTAPPVEGKANQAVIDFLAKVLDIAPSQIEIVAGKQRRDKIVAITDMSPQEVEQRILTYLQRRSR